MFGDVPLRKKSSDNSFYFQIVKPKSAFVIVDVQNDFISGSLAIINCPAGQNGEDVRQSDLVWKTESLNLTIYRLWGPSTI